VSDSLVFASNRTTSSGHRYADVEGVQYEYPRAYRNQIQTGRRFAYYRSREGQVQPFYFGTGIVGEVSQSPDADRLICAVLDYRPFEQPVPFRDAAGEYLEPNGAIRGYYQRGVRSIPDAVFDRIIDLTEVVASGQTEPLVAPVPRRRPPTRQYASAEHARLVEAVSVAIVERELGTRYPGREIRTMPHSNSGYDIEVGPADPVERFVEVKGTVAKFVDFFISEGERLYAEAHGDRYTLAVVHSIDLEAGTGIAVWFDGEIDDRFELKPTQWRGREART
jgi:Domain of unknown function (DUF3883)